METFNFGGITSTPTSPVRLYVQSALMGKLADTEVENISYRKVAGVTEGVVDTVDVSLPCIKQDAATLDKHADLIILRDEKNGGKPYVSVEQFVDVAYPQGKQASTAMQQALQDLGFETAQAGGTAQRFVANYGLPAQIATLSPSRILALFTKLGAYLGTRRTIHAARLTEPGDLALWASKTPDVAEMMKAKAEIKWANEFPNGDPVMSPQGNQVFARTVLRFKADAPGDPSAYYVDQVRDDEATNVLAGVQDLTEAAAV